MNRRTVIPASLLLVVACATGVAKRDDAAAIAQVQLVSMSPSPGSEVTTETVLVAEIKYSIENYKPGVDYYVAPLFASMKGAGMTFNMLDRISESPKISRPAGTITVRYPIAREFGSTELERPVKLWFYVMERTGARETRVIGKTEQIEFRTAAGVRASARGTWPRSLPRAFTGPRSLSVKCRVALVT